MIDDEGAGFGALWFPVAPVQDGKLVGIGSPDGVALVPPCTGVVQFLSYEGDFTPLDGQAAGAVSTNLPVMETVNTPIGHALQLDGLGLTYNDFTWRDASPASPGDLNPGQFMQTPVFADLSVAAEASPPAVIEGGMLTVTAFPAMRAPA